MIVAAVIVLALVGVAGWLYMRREEVQEPPVAEVPPLTEVEKIEAEVTPVEPVKPEEVLPAPTLEPTVVLTEEEGYVVVPPTAPTAVGPPEGWQAWRSGHAHLISTTPSDISDHWSKYPWYAQAEVAWHQSLAQKIGGGVSYIVGDYRDIGMKATYYTAPFPRQQYQSCPYSGYALNEQGKPCITGDPIQFQPHPTPTWISYW